LTGRERFQRALEGADVAFAPLLWERLPELVRQDTPRWWQEAVRGRSLILDAAGIAAADAMFVAAADEAAATVAAEARGSGALETIVEHPEIRAGFELLTAMRDTVPFAVIAALPDAVALARRFDAAEPDDAEDALSELARESLSAGADALAVLGDDAGDVRDSALRVAGIGRFFGRPVLGLCATAAGMDGWAEGAAGAVAALAPDGAWPALRAGVVITPGDVSGRWDADTLRTIAGSRP
jgi:hypothetical protein